MFAYVFFLLSLTPFTLGETFLYANSLMCGSDQFFNSANQQCETCEDLISNTQPTNSSLDCTCLPSYKLKYIGSGISYFSCTPCSNVMTCNLRARACTPSTLRLQAYQNNAFFDAEVCLQCSMIQGPFSQSVSCDYSIPITGSTNVLSANDSPFVREQLPAAYRRCAYATLPYITACQALANLCVLQMYETTASACIQYIRIWNTRTFTLNNIPSWKSNLPLIYYNYMGPNLILSQVNVILSSGAINATYTFGPDSAPLDLVLSKYYFNGTYMGSENASFGGLQLCPDRPEVEEKAFIFGTSYRQSVLSVQLVTDDALCQIYTRAKIFSTCGTYSNQSSENILFCQDGSLVNKRRIWQCQISSVNLADQNKYPPIMFDLNLRFRDASNVVQLYPVPVLIISDQFPSNSDPDRSSWQLVRRFFLVDSVTQADDEIVRYASSLFLNVTMQNLPDSAPGTIHPPYLAISYSSIHMSNNTMATTSFAIVYTVAVNHEALAIAVSVFAILGIIYGCLQTNNWMRRQGLLVLEGSSLLMSALFISGSGGNMIFLFVFGYASYITVFYKTQQVVTALPPNEEQQYFFLLLLTVVFVLKFVEFIMLVFFQCFCDIFFLDWENSAPDIQISIWRSCFLAKQWNGIQTIRKTNFFVQLVVVLIFLELFGFKSMALETPSAALNQTVFSPNNPIPVYNPVLRFATAALIYILVAAMQIFYRLWLHERFILDKIRNFVDLCSVSNISVFILTHKNFGYYIHGRSVHGKADTNMFEMQKMLKKEEDNLLPDRGLETGSSLQTFSIAISPRFRQEYDQIYHLLEKVRHQSAASDIALNVEKVRVYNIMRSFLRAFLENTLTAQRYVIRDRSFIEGLLDMEFDDVNQVQPLDHSIFYHDASNSFTCGLFYGKEMTLLSFEIILFTYCDYHLISYYMSAFILLVIVQSLTYLRLVISRSNLAKKTLIDKRFLL